MINSLDGLHGARSLAAVSEPSLNVFYGALERMDAAHERLTQAGISAMLPADQHTMLVAQFTDLNARGGQLALELDEAASVAQEQSWVRAVGEFANQVDAFAGTVDFATGAERMKRGTKIVLVLLGSAVLLGGGAYVVSKMSQKGARSRRRRLPRRRR